MRVGVCLILIALGSGPVAAGELDEGAYRPRHDGGRYGPLLPWPDVAEQAFVERGPRLLLEDDGLALFAPVLAPRRLPSHARTVRVQAEQPWYEFRTRETRAPRTVRRYGRRAAER